MTDLRGVVTRAGWHKPNPRFDTKWYARARCKDMRTDLFFSDDELDIEQAKAICSTCPVRQECLAMALVNDERYGVWGGLSAQERRGTRDPRAARAAG